MLQQTVSLLQLPRLSERLMFRSCTAFKDVFFVMALGTKQNNNDRINSNFTFFITCCFFD